MLHERRTPLPTLPLPTRDEKCLERQTILRLHASDHSHIHIFIQQLPIAVSRRTRGRVVTLISTESCPAPGRPGPDIEEGERLGPAFCCTPPTLLVPHFDIDRHAIDDTSTLHGILTSSCGEYTGIHTTIAAARANSRVLAAWPTSYSEAKEPTGSQRHHTRLNIT